jgi:acetyl esterase/lipase
MMDSAAHRLVFALALIAIVGADAGLTIASGQELFGVIERDITYDTVDGVALKLDLYYPSTWNAPAPLAVYVHGGAWMSGDKGSGAGLVDRDELLRRGYVVASINYRLAPTHHWPAQIEDCKAAIRFLRANAMRFGVDPARIGVWGSSAGGHLVAMLGTADESDGFDGSGGNHEVSSRVNAVVDMFGPSDLTRAGLSSTPIWTLLGPGVSIQALASASPVTYVTPNDAPFLILHGDQDTTVPLAQSEILHARLLAAGIPSTLVVVRNAGHGFRPVGGMPMPTRTELTTMVADFFDLWVGMAPTRPRRHLH